MRAVVIVVVSKKIELSASIGQREEDLDVQALVAQPSVEAPDVAVFHRTSRPNEVQIDLVSIRPEIHGLAGELRAVVHSDRLWRAATGEDSIERRSHLFAADGRIGMQQDNVRYPESPLPCVPASPSSRSPRRCRGPRPAAFSQFQNGLVFGFWAKVHLSFDPKLHLCDDGWRAKSL